MSVPTPDGERAELTNFGLASDVQGIVAWLLAWRSANNDAERNAAVLNRAVRFLRGEREGLVCNIDELVRNDATCAQIYSLGRMDAERRHESDMAQARSDLATARAERDEARELLVIANERVNWLRDVAYPNDGRG